MSKLSDAFEEYLWHEGRRPLLLPVAIIPPGFTFIKLWSDLSFRETLTNQSFWLFGGGVILISGVLFWFVNRERLRLPLSGALVIVGGFLVVDARREPSLPPNTLVVGIAKFSAFDGANELSFREKLYEKLQAKIDEKAPLFVKKIDSVVEDSASGEAKQRAISLGRSTGAHIVLWGKVRKEPGPDGKSDLHVVGPNIAFCSPIQTVRIDETEVRGFNKAEPDTLEIDEREYARNIADIVAFVCGLAYYKAQKWDLAKDAFDKAPIGAAILFGGLSLYNRAQKSTSPEDDLLGAIAIFQSLIDSHSDHPAEGDDEVRRAACLDKASALATLSRISPDETLKRLGEAKDAYLRALECCPKDKSPLDWAMAQSDLGNVLTDLALITGDVTGQLKEAIERHEEALEVYSTLASKDDSDAAITQTNLGTAYYELGVRLKDDKAEKYLGKAVGAFRAATQVFNRKASPRNWATLSIYTAGALAELGSRESDRGDQTASENDLRQAVETARSAASVFREKDEEWAQAKANLAYVLYQWAKRKSGDAGNKLLREAIAESQNALTVYDEGGLSWAIAKETLGGCLSELGTRTPGSGGEAFLRDAITAYQAALRLRDELEQNEDWAKTHCNLGSALAELGSRKEGAERASLLRDALTNFDLALAFYDHRDRYDVQTDLRTRRAVVQSQLVTG